ncbi:MAG: phosphoglucomutase/phosphomannomutase family protein [Dehalococcoidia bacterium]
MSTTTIRFGTDGWRAVIGEDFTFANVRRCAHATALYLKEAGLAGRGVVVGYDTRFASEAFAAAVAEVMTANDVPVFLCDRPAPTPVVGHAILGRRAAGSVVITASHNPPEYSGFKVRTEYAGAAPPDVLSRIEALLPQITETPRLTLTEATAKDLLEVFNPQPDYLAHLSELVDLDALRAGGLRLVVDSMHGAGAGYLRRLLAGGKTRVWEVRSARNPLFPGMHNPEPIPRNLSPLRRAVARHGAQVGLATDGDADRLGVLDSRGRFVNQLQTFALLAYYLLEVRGLRGPIVKSVTTTSMVPRLGELYGVPVHETAVGFKYLGPKMRDTDAIIAGEESGGYAFRGHLPERDGILSALYFLDLMARRGKDPADLVAELFRKVGPHYYDRVDIEMSADERTLVEARLPELKPDIIAGLRVTGIDTKDGLRFKLEDGAWALIRLSGTEPLMRIYTEVPREELVPVVLAQCRELTGV